ncbi:MULTISPECIES: hypothetical protein [Pseudomonas]|jgi:hypothetical protein|uniref:hypothetical protein n=1 Tax=Pseudomonas TaxID=286 RepID=UPI000C2AC50F|nr:MULTISPECIES: hypothetical protein [Pseudomonas]PJX11564.1 hypothetical protein CQW32_04920 [Pseudomonas putida]
MSLTRRWPRHLRRAASITLWVILLLALAVAVNVLGIQLAGSIESWQQWLADHTGHFLVWRLLLYAATAWGWMWMRRRVLAREPGARQRLLQAEIAAVMAVAALEVSQVIGG